MAQQVDSLSQIWQTTESDVEALRVHVQQVVQGGDEAAETQALEQMRALLTRIHMCAQLARKASGEAERQHAARQAAQQQHQQQRAAQVVAVAHAAHAVAMARQQGQAAQAASAAQAQGQQVAAGQLPPRGQTNQQPQPQQQQVTQLQQQQAQLLLQQQQQHKQAAAAGAAAMAAAAAAVCAGAGPGTSTAGSAAGAVTARPPAGAYVPPASGGMAYAQVPGAAGARPFNPLLNSYGTVLGEPAIARPASGTGALFNAAQLNAVAQQAAALKAQQQQAVAAMTAAAAGGQAAPKG